MSDHKPPRLLLRPAPVPVSDTILPRQARLLGLSVLLLSLVAPGLVSASPIAGRVPEPAGKITPSKIVARPIPSAKVAVAPGAPRATATVIRMTLKVVHPDAVRAKLISATRAQGGHPMLMTDHVLQLKIPPTHLNGLIALTAKQGLVLDKTLTRNDLTESIAQRRGRLRSRERLLKQLLHFIDDSNVAATLKIERTMSKLVAEVEGLKGQLAVEQERARYAQVYLSFRFRRRGSVSYRRSPFKWINTVDLQRFLKDF